MHTKTRNKLEQAGTIWNELEPSRMSWNKLERAGIRWSYSRFALERVRVVSCSGSCIRQEIWGNLTITQTCRASKDMEFWVNNMSWRSTAPSEFLFNILILIFYFSYLMVCKLIGDLVNCHALFQRSFFAFLKTDQDQSKS